MASKTLSNDQHRLLRRVKSRVPHRPVSRDDDHLPARSVDCAVLAASAG